jgi:hypothetical protein
MDSAIEQFIRRYFNDRTEALKARLSIHQTYRKRFYHGDCFFDSRRGVIESSQNESIDSILTSEGKAYVITSGKTVYRSRYNLKPLATGWLIDEVDMECPLCRATGISVKCAQCGGSEWLNWKMQSAMLLTRRSRTFRQQHCLVSSDQRHSRPERNASLEEFMLRHFQERSASLKKETEVQREFVERYFNPECDWQRWLPSVHQSETEEILSMIPAPIGKYVFTTGTGFLQLRYNTYPTEQSWLIRKVDHECPMCSESGRRENCFFCGGTIWEHRKHFDRGESGDQPRFDNPRW